MQFITNRIRTGGTKTFEDFVKDYKDSMKIKTAFAEEVVKTAEQEEAESSGQLDVEPLHQTGESTTMPKNGPSAKKDESLGSTSKVVKEKDEADSSGQPEAEGKLVNDPKVEKEAEVKEAGELPEHLKEYQFKSKDDKDGEDKDGEDKDGEDDDTDEKKEAGKTERGKRDGTGPFKDSFQNKNKDKGKRKQDGEKCPNEKDDDKEASSEVKFIKVANLDSKNKSFLLKYWTKLFGADYANAMLAEK